MPLLYMLRTNMSWEMAQSSLCLPQKHEDLPLDLQHPCDKPSVALSIWDLRDRLGRLLTPSSQCSQTGELQVHQETLSKNSIFHMHILP